SRPRSANPPGAPARPQPHRPERVDGVIPWRHTESRRITRDGPRSETDMSCGATLTEPPRLSIPEPEPGPCGSDSRAAAREFRWSSLSASPTPDLRGRMRSPEALFRLTT